MVSIWKAIPLSEYLALTGESQDEDAEIQTTPNNSDAQILQFLTDKNREKGRKILKSLKENNEFKWDENGDVVYRGTKIRNAHMVDLLSISLRTLPIKTTKLAGLQEYTQAIKSMNLPRSLFTASFLKYLDGNNNEQLEASQFGWKKFRNTYLLK